MQQPMEPQSCHHHQHLAILLLSCMSRWHFPFDIWTEKKLFGQKYVSIFADLFIYQRISHLREIWTTHIEQELPALPEPSNYIYKYAVYVNLGENTIGYLKKGIN